MTIMKKQVLIILFCTGYMLSCTYNSKNNDNEIKDTITVEKEVNTNISKTISSSETENNTIIYEEPRIESLSAYVNDPSSSATNVRNAPKGEIIMTLEQGKDYMIEIEAVQNSWFKIKSLSDVDNEITIPGGEAWLHGSVIELATRNYGGETLHLYKNPDSESKIVGTLKTEIALKLNNIKGEWVKIIWINNDKKVLGWIEKKWLCGNPLTNCC